jgi:hypothetical protein
MCGADYEAPMIAAWGALQPNLLAGYNSGFLRDGATLAVIAWDPDGYAEDDGSPQSVQFYLDFFTSLKGGNTQLVNVSMMYTGLYGPFTTGPRYTALTRDSGGLLIDTTGPDWTTQITKLWGAVTAGSGGFALSGSPVPATIQVWLDGPPPGPGVTTPGVQVPEQNPNGVVNWQYSPISNTVVINSQSYGIQATDTITVVYTLACN